MSTTRGKESSAPGVAPLGMIPLAVPFLGDHEWKYVKEALDTNWVSSVGPFVERFERETAAAVGAKHAVAVSSGSAALHVALLLAGVGPGDEVIMPSLTFIAPANAVSYVGASPVFIDCDPAHWQLDVTKVEAYLEQNCAPASVGVVDRKTGRRVAALLPVHVLGHPVDMDPLMDVAGRYGLPVVEDAAEAMGASYRGRSPGTFGLVGCLSFNGNKVITTGGGGVLLIGDENLVERAQYLVTQAKDDAVEYVHGEVGFNYRLSNVLAAIGCAQLEVLERNVAAKRQIAQTYTDAFADVPGLTPMKEASWARSTFWLYTMRVDPIAFGIDSRTLLRRLADRGIQARPLWQPLHLSSPFAGCIAYRCDHTVEVEAEALSLPSSSGLSPDDQARVVESVLLEATR